MHCLISVVLRQWSAVHAEAQAAKRSLLALAAGVDLPRPPALQAATGFLLAVDWDRGEVLGGLELAKPTGFALDGDRVHVALWHDDQIVTLAGAEPVRRASHPWFNHLHTLDRTPRGLLVTSSGSDLIAELDERGEVIWSYFLFEHGYAGRRYPLASHFDRAATYRQRYLPAALTTHPNSAILVDDDHVLATLFTPGEVVRIDRRTGEVEVVLGGLRRPHAIRRRAGGGFYLCDSEGGAVVVLDRALAVEARIAVAAPWIQDAVFSGDRLLVVANRRLASLTGGADAGGDNCVLELAGGEPRRQLSFGVDHRVYMVEPLAAATAEALAHAWRGRAPLLPELRWSAAC
jgi:hypothetical protein